ncbi:MAG: hypothetical protein E6284_26620 [Klebsiella pneumoniae]|nr:hypothetical protein [Klebsiella pneumoniae]MDU7235207.1 hypothetical protein [Klebsiella pneumoniae]
MTDITELAQMKGQKVEGSYYLAECTDCGKMYPSNKLNGGEPLFSGDYGECYCPHCGADDAAIGDCGDTAAAAWNYQQGRIDALVEALEKAQRHANLTEAERQAYLGLISKRDERIAELEEAEQQLCAANVTLDARAELAERQLADLESRTVKMPEPFKLAKSSSGLTYYFADDVDAALSAAGIKVEVE